MSVAGWDILSGVRIELCYSWSDCPSMLSGIVDYPGRLSVIVEYRGSDLYRRDCAMSISRCPFVRFECASMCSRVCILSIRNEHGM